MNAPEPLMNAVEAATYLKVSVGHVYNLVSRAEIPFVRIGTSVRFRRSELDRWVDMKSGRTDAAAGA